MKVRTDDPVAGEDVDAITLRMHDIMVVAKLDNDAMNARVQAFNRPAPADCGMLVFAARTKVLKLHSMVVVRSFFGSVTRKITTCLRDTLALHPMDYVLLVGGFGNSPVLLHEVQSVLCEMQGDRRFGGRPARYIDVMRPEHPGTAVVTGAALYPLQPTAETPCAGSGR